ncbi:FAD-binding oxidoreductase [Paraflavitalea speifideaquila]|uniref:FAD-binding oxidoreductase n=1 Tax=Paraflavitalea speifideaquila TaxID=3076558 RepID=UPI0028F00B0F|nr:FAD-binding oxidoreductase [Paraflavitalea speifideiaquila]
MDLFQWKVIRVIPEARNTISYVLQETSGQPVIYEAGQFLTFLFDYHGQEIRRSYSLGSTPGIDQQPFITVKKKENGAISRYILDHWTEGTLINSLPPAGMFTLPTPTSQARHLFFWRPAVASYPYLPCLKTIAYRTTE